MRFRLVVDGESREIDVDPGPEGPVVRIDGAEYVTQVESSPSEFVIRIGQRSHRIRLQGRSAFVDDTRHDISIPDVEGVSTARPAESASRGATLVEVRPPMPGRVIRLLVAPGTEVARGQILLVLEAMKMQNEIPAPHDGIVREFRVAEGESITADRVVAVLEVRWLVASPGCVGAGPSSSGGTAGSSTSPAPGAGCGSTPAPHTTRAPRSSRGCSS